MKAKAIWIAIALACLAGLVLTARSDWRIVTKDAVLVTGTVAAIQPDPKRRAGRWYAVYHVPTDQGQLTQVRDSSPGSGRPPAVDSQVQLVHPAGRPELAQPIALGKRALAYLVMLGFLIIALAALFTRRGKSEPGNPAA